MIRSGMLGTVYDNCVRTICLVAFYRAVMVGMHRREVTMEAGWALSKVESLRTHAVSCRHPHSRTANTYDYSRSQKVGT